LVAACLIETYPPTFLKFVLYARNGLLNEQIGLNINYCSNYSRYQAEKENRNRWFSAIKNLFFPCQILSLYWILGLWLLLYLNVQITDNRQQLDEQVPEAEIPWTKYSSETYQSQRIKAQCRYKHKPKPYIESSL